ncbi:RidA family protein [Gordonia jinhuaensis]|uniref:Enamine deaminase RidA n=1 Tax=Gordonia jinhuaensis TaxID=1517702 RepID=A0A916X1I7_9ACTN|nr:RidA family protein [Gordonia jinhuaensis]GGB47151.1 enamine deaminase RidA [Gordonia jinhuaensis]
MGATAHGRVIAVAAPTLEPTVNALPEKGTAMTVSFVNPPTLLAPSGFSHATRHKDTIHLAGQTALTPEGVIVEGGIVEQFHQALSNFLEALRSAGGRPDGLLSMTIYLTDIPEYQANGRRIGEIWRELTDDAPYPAMAGIGVVGLWQPEAMIEIQGVAAAE